MNSAMRKAHITNTKANLYDKVHEGLIDLSGFYSQLHFIAANI